MAKNVVSSEALRQVLINIGELFVRKEANKRLSTNDFTTELKNKLEGLENLTVAPATTATLGGVIVGSGLTVDANGEIALDTIGVNDVDGLSTALSGKASASDLATLAGAVNDANTGLATRAAAADIVTLNTQINHNATGLNQRVLQSTYATDKAALEASIAAKVASTTLFDNGIIKSDLLPSFVDDVVEGYYDSTAGKFYKEQAKTTEITGETGKIYLDLTSNCSYRYGGSAYALITSADIVLVGDNDVDALFDEIFDTDFSE